MFRKRKKLVPLKLPHRLSKLEYLVAIGSGLLCVCYTWYPMFKQVPVDNKTETNIESPTE